MMKILLTFALLVFAANATFAQTDAQSEKIRNDIRRVISDQTAAWNAGDIEGFMRGYWNSPELKFVSGANVTKGWQPTLDRYKKSYDSRAKMGVLTFSDLDINVLSKDAAIVLGTWKLQRDADAPGGKFTLVFRKLKDGWRIVHDHTS
jgi:ketosteroid isomerase-like protein